MNEGPFLALELGIMITFLGLVLSVFSEGNVYFRGIFAVIFLIGFLYFSLSRIFVFRDSSSKDEEEG